MGTNPEQFNIGTTRNSKGETVVFMEIEVPNLGKLVIRLSSSAARVLAFNLQDMANLAQLGTVTDDSDDGQTTGRYLQ